MDYTIFFVKWQKNAGQKCLSAIVVSDFADKYENSSVGLAEVKKVHFFYDN